MMTEEQHRKRTEERTRRMNEEDSWVEKMFPTKKEEVKKRVKTVAHQKDNTTVSKGNCLIVKLPPLSMSTILRETQLKKQNLS